MSITGVSQSSAQATWSTTASQRNDAFNSLDQALSSGDLAGAQSAMANLQQLAPQGGQGGSNDPFAAVSAALQSGDISGAQSAFAALKQQMAAHKGHHHHGPPPSGPPPSDPSTTTASTSTSSASSTGGLDITA